MFLSGIYFIIMKLREKLEVFVCEYRQLYVMNTHITEEQLRAKYEQNLQLEKTTFVASQ